MKKAISLFLLLMIILTITVGLDFLVYADETENGGNCGNNATYYFNSATGVLTIEGVGVIDDYGHNEAPWYPFSESIRKVSIKEGITTIGERAFESCNLYDLELPTTLSKINNWAFYGASNVENVYISDLESWFNVKIGYSYAAPLSFSNSKNRNMYLDNTLITNITVPNNVNEINSYLFYDCTSLESITIPSNINSIGGSAFRGCNNLQSVKIENGVDKIKDWTFADCTALKDLSITNSITVIGDYSFYDCKSLSAINYTGTESDWNNTKIGSNNEYLANSIINSHCVNNNDHIIVIDKEIPSTCINTGLSQGSHCSKCGGIIEEQKIMPISTHSYLRSVVQATATSEGYIKYTCSVCGDTYNADYFDAASVYSDISSAKAGSTIRVPVSIKNNTGILGWELKFDYDVDVLTPISVDYGDVISGGIQDNIAGDMVPGSINIYWAGSDNENYNGVMFYINFEVNQSAVGNTKIDITYSPEDTFDTDFNDIYLDCQPINLSITNNAYSQYAKINASAEDVTAGDELQLKLNISEINSVTKTNVTVDYNTDNFEFKSVNFANGITVKNTNNNGKLALDISGITSTADDTDFVTVTFKCKDKAMSGTYDFVVSSADKGIICKGCSVKVNPSATSEIAKISIPDGITGQNGDLISVPVNIENNHGIMGYRITVKFNPDELEIISADKSNEFAGNFNDSIGNKTGEFDLLWNNTEEIIKDGYLFTLKFNVITQNDVTSKIQISYSQEDTFNEEYSDVVFNCTDSEIKLCYQHNYILNVVSPTCGDQGYNEYICAGCGNDLKTEYTDAMGHMYEFIDDYNNEMNYICNDCGNHISKPANQIYAMWDIKYVNKPPKRTAVDDSCYLDVVNDNVINAKDFAVINKLSKIPIESK